VLRYGRTGTGPKAYLQAGLHADELPGMLALHHLAELLDEAAAKGEILGEIVIVPQCNPIGLTQIAGGYMRGRVEDHSGANFNRGYPDLTQAVASRIKGRLSQDPQANIALIRETARQQMAEASSGSCALAAMRFALLERAIDADLVLDLHADNEALLHLYTGPALWPAAADIAAEIDARAVLLAEVSGDNPFDEACSRLWWDLAARFEGMPIPPACVAATLELRCNNSIDARDALDDAHALYRILQRRGMVAGTPGDLPRLTCEATPLSGMQQLRAPMAGIVVYHARLGDRMRVGDLVAEVIAPLGETKEVRAQTDGLLFARHDQPYAWADKVIGKIAGATPLPERTGSLLTD
ncbi:MAG: succinylglutamate desuccinylase/aspartoacylase family protein, partial [Mangrovicoccus sp.]|nr:succinylglutamate desuccinylase/aspartoacylase family protein [Mangrovicoccus sp.]